jgi:hypothetical protein
MNIRQIQVANDSVQDRLVLRIGTQGNEEIRIFFTRRFLRELWPHLTAMLAGHLGARPLLTPAGEAAAETPAATFSEPFRDDASTYPLGANPLLASEATLEPAGDGVCRLLIREGRERSFNLNLNSDLLQALCAMLRAASDQAAWNLQLDYAPAPASAGSPPAGNKLLH